jgi:hypothetical protein
MGRKTHDADCAIGGMRGPGGRESEACVPSAKTASVISSAPKALRGAARERASMLIERERE